MVRYLMSLGRGHGVTDDIDHLGNRRVRTIGELLEGQFRLDWQEWRDSIRRKWGFLIWKTLCREI